MRKRYDDSEWRTMIFDDAYTTDLYADSYEGLLVSQEKMQKYLDVIQRAVFDNKGMVFIFFLWYNVVYKY